jgi:aspartate kinase
LQEIAIVPLLVQKFGGSSVADSERIMNAARRVIRAKKAGHQVVVVVSARGDTTDELIELAHQITENPPAREMDMLLATGEQISIALLAMAIQSLGEQAVSLTGAQVGIVTDSTFTKARIRSISTQRMRHALEAGNIVIVAGFQGSDEDGNITTLGRGGSDTTAVALASVLKYDNRGDANVGCEFYTDVDGIFTTDPRVVPDARKLDVVSYEEMLELASVGANVLASRSIEFAKKFSVPMQKRSSFSDVEGTWIVPEAEWMRKVPVCGAAMNRDEARVMVKDVPDEPGISHRIFSSLADHAIVVDMIAQNVGSAGRASIGFTAPGNELREALRVLKPLAAEMGATVEYEESVSKVSIVGTGMRTQTGVAEKMFACLAAEGVPIKMITTGDIKISVLVDKTDGVKALRAVHRAFGLDQPRLGAGQPIPKRTTASETGHGDLTERDLAQIARRMNSMEDIVVSDVLLNTDQGRITVFDLPDKVGGGTQLFEAVAAAGISVDMIVQNLSTPGRAVLSFSVPREDLVRAQKVTADAARSLDPHTRVVAEPDIAQVIVLGVGMRTHTGVARRMFGALAKLGINIGMINTSEVRLSVVVDRAHGAAAAAALREAFGL